MRLIIDGRTYDARPTPWGWGLTNDQGDVYHVVLQGGQPASCSCPHHHYRRVTCKHMEALMSEKQKQDTIVRVHKTEADLNKEVERAKELGRSEAGIGRFKVGDWFVLASSRMAAYGYAGLSGVLNVECTNLDGGRSRVSELEAEVEELRAQLKRANGGKKK